MAAENTWVSGSEQSYLDLHPCMREAGVGRVLVASLHQGIADVLPTRLEFYENWLDAKGLREGTIGLAPLYAVLSFLRQEGEAYGKVTTSAGEYAAEWTVESMGSLERCCCAPPQLAAPPAGAAPRPIASCARATGRTPRLQSPEGDAATLDLRASVFCDVRDPSTTRSAASTPRRLRGCSSCSKFPRRSKSRHAARLAVRRAR